MNDLPLSGYRVVSLAINVPGPVASARLRELGAHVTKVEPPSGDFLARAAPTWYELLCEGQTVVTLDLKSVGGRHDLDVLLHDADVLITSSRPSALGRLGLASGDVLERYARLCIVAIVGHATPNAERAGHDVTYQAEAGLVSPEAMPLSLFADVAAGESAVAAALALLLQRTRTGRGGFVEVALADAASRMAAPRRHGLTRAGGVLGGALPTYALYAASDGVVALAALEPHFAARIRADVGDTEADAAAFARHFATRTAREWEAWGREHDVPIAIVTAPRAHS